MAHFIPPFPPRLSQTPGAFARLRLAAGDFLAMWEEGAFEVEFSSEKVLSRWTFLCNSPESVQFAFNARNESFERKSPQMRHALSPLLGDGLFVSDGEVWKARRGMVAAVLHISGVAGYAPLMLTSARDVAERWTRQEGERDILSEMAGLTADIICRSLFGHALGAEFAREIVEGFSDYQASIGRLDLVSLLGLPEWTPRWRSPAARRATRRIHAALDRIIARHRASADGGGLSMIDGLMRARDERGAAMSDEGLRNEIAVLFMAGHETTANTMTWVWYLLSQAPDVEARLHAELAEVLGGREPGFADVGALPYARAVIEETMRLYPPVPILPREATRDETYNGVKIPRGSLLFVVPWLLHRHKKLWREPDCFMPERFLPGGDEPVSKYAYVPFSVGPRVCAGLSFGMTEMILCLASLAQRFRLRPRAGYVARPVCRLTLRPEGGMPMIVTPRAPVAGSSAASVPRAPGCPAHHA